MACTTCDTNTDAATPTAADRAAEARGFAVAFDACAAVFLNEPTAQVLGDVRRVAQALGDSSLDDACADARCEAEEGAALRQRFYDRAVVVSSPVYVPLQESCVYGSTVDDKGVAHYNTVNSTRGDHALRCYKTLGFDFESLPGYHILTKVLRCDYISCELAFLAFMKNGEAQAWEHGDEQTAEHWHGLATRFARDHAGTWIGTAAERLAASDDDVYARVCAFAANVVKTLVDEV